MHMELPVNVGHQLIINSSSTLVEGDVYGFFFFFWGGGDVGFGGSTAAGRGMRNI